MLQGYSNDVGSRTAAQTEFLGGTPRLPPPPMGRTPACDGLGLSMARLLPQPMGSSGSSRIPGSSVGFVRGAILFFGIGRPAETETLPGLAGNQHRARPRRQRRPHRSPPGTQ